MTWGFSHCWHWEPTGRVFEYWTRYQVGPLYVLVGRPADEDNDDDEI